MTTKFRTLVRYQMRDLEWVGETITGIYLGNHKTMWLLDVDGERVELLRDEWTVCAA